MDCSKGWEKPSFWRHAGRGLSASKPDGLEILSETAGARGETKSFFNGLISRPA